ncbi:hypothetical protein LP419_13235 [Massilia sp. H-1]|nr:hypothetical protein LP419_13235 [Massilia sp. H-1]
MLAAADPRGAANSEIASDADWVDFNAVVSTSRDQIAIAPGTLEKEWIASGRRYFHYRMDKPILNFYAFQSARYEVRHDRWQDVTIDVYYHPGHEYNLERIVKGVKAAFEYNAKNFSPYQHKVVRIVEFPRYSNHAQSFPNTIPFSESIGFIAKVDDKNPKDIDYPFYVTAHEIAHQWWGHQLVGADTAYGQGAVGNAVRIRRPDGDEAGGGPGQDAPLPALRPGPLPAGPRIEKKRELPLAQSERQDYLYYRKGSLAMYLLQDVIGEDKVNGVLRAAGQACLRLGALSERGRTGGLGLRAIASAEQQYLIDDLFNAIVLYQNRAVRASAVRRADGKYVVTLTASA